MSIASHYFFGSLNQDQSKSLKVGPWQQGSAIGPTHKPPTPIEMRAYQFWRKLNRIAPLIGLALPLMACTSAKNYDPPFNPNEKAEKQIPPFYGMGMPGYMSRQEVILANNECEDAGMRPRVLYMTMTVLEKKIPVPVDVHCEPKRRQVTSPYFHHSSD